MNLLFLLALLLFVVRIIMLINIDRYRNKNALFKVLFGAYALEAMLPILRKTEDKKEESLIRSANICLILFYTFMISFFISVFIMYK
jgi:hypothetical protein